jgi:hypothetical protein
MLPPHHHHTHTHTHTHTAPKFTQAHAGTEPQRPALHYCHRPWYRSLTMTSDRLTPLRYDREMLFSGPIETIQIDDAVHRSHYDRAVTYTLFKTVKMAIDDEPVPHAYDAADIFLGFKKAEKVARCVRLIHVQMPHSVVVGTRQIRACLQPCAVRGCAYFGKHTLYSCARSCCLIPLLPMHRARSSTSSLSPCSAE